MVQVSGKGVLVVVRGSGPLRSMTLRIIRTLTVNLFRTAYIDRELPFFIDGFCRFDSFVF